MVGIDLYSSQMPWSLHKHSMYIARTQLPTARWIIYPMDSSGISIPSGSNIWIYSDKYIYIDTYIYNYIYVWLYIWLYECFSIIFFFGWHLCWITTSNNWESNKWSRAQIFPQVCRSGPSTATSFHSAQPSTESCILAGQLPLLLTGDPVRSADVCWTIQSSLWWTSSPHGWTAGAPENLKDIL